jgi:hypothetical protein
MDRPREALVLFVVMAKKANSAASLGTEEMRIREETRKDDVAEDRLIATE